jgi:S-(hydroxymethyl)glutathione dehydrogenase / alcohol dehydrogenase
VRAVVFSGPAHPLQIEDVQLERPKTGEVRVQISAAGVCRSDLHSRVGDWPRRVPLVMGHEGSGIVVEVGSGVTSVVPGDHAVLSWQPACGRCRRCVAGRPQQCELVADVVAPLGVLYDGTSRLRLRGQPVFHYSGVSSFAEEAVLPESGVVRVPVEVPLSSAALLGCCVTTGVGAVLWTARVNPGATVVVIGCGAVGLNAVQGARLAAAAQIIAVDPLADKLELAKEFGATKTLLARSSEAVAEVRDLTMGGADFAFDCIGLPDTVGDAIKMLGVGGCAVLVGLPAVADSAEFSPYSLVGSEQRILGSYYGSSRPPLDFPFLANLYISGRLKIDELITSRRPLEEAEAALDDLRAGRGIKTVLEPSPQRVPV